MQGITEEEIVEETEAAASSLLFFHPLNPLHPCYLLFCSPNSQLRALGRLGEDYYRQADEKYHGAEDEA